MLFVCESRKKKNQNASRFGFTSPRSGESPPLALREAVDSNTRADLRIDFITKSCDNDS